MNKLPFISIVVLTWNSREDVLSLLRSIYRSSYPKSHYEVIVVDNASSDKTTEAIKQTFPKVKLIALTKNLGMPALNVGYKKARGDIICEIQSDVTIAKDFLKIVAEKIQSDKNIGLLGVRVFDKKTNKILPPTIRFNFYTGIISPKFYDHETSDFDYLEGLVHVFPRWILKKVGFIDPKYFFYGDDPDFSLRIKKKGYKVVFTPDTHVYHGKSKSSPMVFSMKYHHYYKAAFRIVYTYGNILQKISTTILQLTVIPLYLLIIKRRNTFQQRLWGLWWNFKNARIYTKFLLVSLIIGIILRTYALYTNEFWFDEAFTYFVAKLPFSPLLEAILIDNNPPLYYLIIHYVLMISHNEIIIRLPSLVLNLATLYFLFKLLNTYINRKVALIATSLFSLSPLAIYLSSTVRLHSLALFLVTLTIWLFLKLINNLNLKNAVLFILFAILGIYSQYYFALLFIPFAWIVIQRKTKLSFRYWTIITLIIAIVFFPWLYLSARTIHNACSCPNTLVALPATLASPMLGGIGEVTLRSFYNLPFYYILFFLATSLFYLVFFLKGLIEHKNLTLLYILPLSILAASGFFLPTFSPKGFAIFSPIFFAITAIGIFSFKYKLNIAITSFVLIGTISIMQLIDPFFSGIPLKQMQQIIKTHQNAPIAHISFLSYYSMRYYTQDKQTNILLTKNLLPKDLVKKIGEDSQKIDKKTDQLWLIDTDKWVDQNERKALLKTIYKDFTLIEYYQLGTASVSYFVQLKTAR